MFSAVQISSQVVVGGTVLLGMLGTGTGVVPAGSVVTGHPGCSVGITGSQVQSASGVGVFSLGGIDG